MKTTWWMIAVMGILSLGSLAALSVDLPDATAAESEPTAAEQADPDGGYTAPEASKTQSELPPDMRETADFDISFPIDI